MSKVVCYECPNRSAECHISCEVYKEYAAEMAQKRNRRNAQKEIMREAADYIKSTRRRMARGRNKQ